MPLTSDLKLVSSEGILYSPKVPQTRTDLQTRSFYLDGCSNYNSKIYNILTMFNMRNKDNVRITESFAVYLWALDPAFPENSYVIAKKETEIYLQQSDFSVGSVVALFVTAVDTYIIQRHTRFSISFRTVDPIPNNSKIKVRFPAAIGLVNSPCTLQSVSDPFNLTASCLVELNTVIVTFPFLAEASYDPKVMGSIKFSFDTGGMNPTVACDAGSFLISTYAIFDGVDYGIDVYHY